jgi:cysteine-rich repeat protein
MSQSGGVGAFGQTAQSSVEVTLCGNSTIDAGEQCDDGNLTDGDGCSARCVDEQACTALPNVPFATYALSLTSTKNICFVETLQCSSNPPSSPSPATLRLVANPGYPRGEIYVDGYLDAPGIDLDGNGTHSEQYYTMAVDNGGGWGFTFDPTSGASEVKLWGDNCIGDYWIGKTLVTVKLASGEVTSFERHCETHYNTLWYDIWVSGTGTLVCQ